MGQVAKKANLDRTHLYRMLSDQGNPELKSVSALLSTLGFRLAVAPNKTLSHRT